MSSDEDTDVKKVVEESGRDSDLPMMGKSSDEGGRDSDTKRRNTAKDRSTVISSETFSPLSTGSRKPSAATLDVSMHGNIMVIR